MSVTVMKFNCWLLHLWVCQVLDGYGVSKVVLSNNSSFKVGDCVSSWTRWEEYSVIPRGQRLKVIDPALAPLSYHAGALGKLIDSSQWWLTHLLPHLITILGNEFV